MGLEESIILLMVVAAAVAMLAQWWKMPYTVALVIAGLGLSLLNVEPPVHLTKDIVFALFLPALLYEAAFHLDIGHFRKNSGPILVLAMVGVILSMLIGGCMVYLGLNWLGTDIALLVAILFAALISATDPISVIAIFKELGLPHRLNLVVEGESLFNDGTAVVMFSLILVAVTGLDAHGEEIEHFSTAWVAMNFGKEVFGGLAVGLVIGLALSFITAQVDDHLIEIMLTTILAYGTYLVADHLHFSGVIAVVVAGMLSGNWGTRVGMSPSTKAAVIGFWEYAAFVVNSLIFLLIGLEVKIADLIEYKWHILVAWVSIVASRAIAINILFPVINRVFPPLPWKWNPILIWGGLRGSLSMALALSLKHIKPNSILGDNFTQHVDLIITLTFGVVIISILGQALSIKPILKLLGMLGKERHDEYEELQARVKSAFDAVEELDKMRDTKSISSFVYEKLSIEYEQRLAETEAFIATMQEEDDEIHAEEEETTRRHLLLMEKEGVREAFSQGMISDEIMKKIMNDIDDRMDALILGHEDDETGDKD